MNASDIAARLAEPYGDFSATLAAWATAQPDAIALRDETGALTWAEMADRIERIAARLVEEGLERGQAVAILGASSIPYALVFLAAVRAGGVAAPLTTSASADQLEEMARDSGADHVFIDRAKLSELGGNCFSGFTRIVLDEELEAWMAPAGTRAPDFTPERSDPFNIIYSSGTTGTPKGIVHSHGMRWTQFASTASSYCASGLEVRALASTPLYSNTTMVAFLAPLLAGGMVRVMGKFDAARWLQHAEEDRTTLTMLVPVQ
ncbi:MAG: class I adenylate-forming enzyme family protein, partial [Pseudomonadota bacterium]|nr:class I adenylate-forming enzyme family protein [Pseudomonadota bacterium]